MTDDTSPEQAKAAWDRVGDHLGELGARFKEQFDARVAFGQIPDREKIETALRTLMEALDNAWRAVSDTLADPRVSDDVRRAADAVGSAVGTTFELAGQQIKKLLGATRPGGAAGDEPPAPEPSS